MWICSPSRRFWATRIDVYKRQHAARYLESLECVFRRILEQYCAKDDPKDARSMLAAAEEVLDMLLLGILKR